VTPPVVVKFGGELLEEASRLRTIVEAMCAAAPRTPLVIVHGGGKEIDAALKAAAIEKRQVDGLRITDEPTLEIVVAVLAGRINTRLVAALATAGVGAVGLTGADGRCGLSRQAPPHRATDGRLVDLGRVGIPEARTNTTLLTAMTDKGFVPVIASIGIGSDGSLFNVNADTFAGHIAASLGAPRLVIAGTTAGVLDEGGGTIGLLEPADVERLIEGRTATAGMIAKLRACEQAIAAGVADVAIVDGRDGAALEAAASGLPIVRGTRLSAVGRGARFVDRP